MTKIYYLIVFIITIYSVNAQTGGGIPIHSDNFLNIGGENSSSGHLKIHNASCCYNTYADIKGNLFFRAEYTQAGLAIQRDGSVTIGVWPTYNNTFVDTQGYKLMVNGGILTEEVKVIGDVPNSDHVFEKDYDLISITELKDYIKENKHLPEIPSAKEFKEKGYSVGEMDDLLLRKVEELTLYIIQLQEEIETLKNDKENLIDNSKK